MRASLVLWLLAACGSSSAALDAKSGDGATPDASIDGAPALDGWLFTDGANIMIHGPTGDTRWMGRGVNLDDIYLCGYNYMLDSLDGGATLTAIASTLVSDWKPTFVRISLGMASYPVQSSWTEDTAQYATPMTSVIEALGANPGVYVLVTLRSDATMMGQDTQDGDAEATGLPSADTDAVYTALVDTFAHDRFVLFGLSNEPGGNRQTSEAIAAAMTHAVATIRAEEDRLGVPHHLISAQGNGWTSDISYYASNPIAGGNIVYEVHGYPPATSSYTYADLPVIIGEYGSLADPNGFYADLEAKAIPNLAWDFEPYSNCTPDLLNVTDTTSDLQPSAWGQTVEAYLAAHEP
ncbi:MAG TPA: cellulase family glycosylhydrolase [Kofleriaceae bacterium]|jgi:hypothetical protein